VIRSSISKYHEYTSYNNLGVNMNTLNDMQIGTKLACDFAIGHIHESGENAILATETAVDTSAKSRELLHDALDGVDEITESINMVCGMAQDIDSGTKHVPDVAHELMGGLDKFTVAEDEYD